MYYRHTSSTSVLPYAYMYIYTASTSRITPHVFRITCSHIGPWAWVCQSGAGWRLGSRLPGGGIVQLIAR